MDRVDKNKRPEVDITSARFDAARGMRLACAMDASRCKRSELSHLCEVSERQITRWRKGDWIHERHIQTISARCEISPDYLFRGDRPGLPSILEHMSDANLNDTDGSHITDELTVNRIPMHRLHISLLRFLRELNDSERIAALDRIINNRWSGPLEPFKGREPVLDSIPLDRYEIAAVLALRAIADVRREISLINHLISVKTPG